MLLLSSLVVDATACAADGATIVVAMDGPRMNAVVVAAAAVMIERRDTDDTGGGALVVAAVVVMDIGRFCIPDSVSLL